MLLAACVAGFPPPLPLKYLHVHSCSMRSDFHYRGQIHTGFHWLPEARQDIKLAVKQMLLKHLNKLTAKIANFTRFD